MQISFLPGGYLNELGPFEPGAVITLPDAEGRQLIANGLALALAPISARPITITITQKTEGADNV